MKDLKQIARRIFLTALADVELDRLIPRKVCREGSTLKIGPHEQRLDGFAEIRMVAFGKAAAPMARAVADLLLPDFRARGIVVAPAAAEVPAGFRLLIAGHPIPNQGSLDAARAVEAFVAGSSASTLVIFLISGGGSALLERPILPSIALAELQAWNALLVGCGATIEEINVLRKHLSAVKGGRLAVLLCGRAATQWTLLVSDVPEGKVSTIASGPTLPDPSTVAECYRIAERYRLLEQMPGTIRKLFTGRELEETPKPGGAAFEQSRYFVLASSRDLAHAAHRAAEAAGFCTDVDNGCDDWPLEKAADYLWQRFGECRKACGGRPVGLVSTGELMCPVTGPGVGGRNQAFVLHMLERIAGQPIAVLSAGSDGADGNSPAAGAVADGASLGRARALGLDPAECFARSDSHSFFRALSDTIETGPTGNNLRDLRLILSA